ncbi:MULTISPECIES: PHP domain-containing protein [Paenibacillus]|uniref:PHP domain-containing protein n=1 Tax=Paenibacillus TaxID=44249 RepID=UPI0022B93E42|nr:PHP domain-containing protein [Paenibacillus caseinilyticus]MCZ8520216.1 PHP domain-containing protein [Paenibacillus caseinilyticus]
MSYADLHTHTIASDGTRPPADNVRLALEAGLSAVAITDHDTVGGLEEAVAAGRTYGIVVVPGVEISTVSAGEDIHVLGYWIDYTDARFLERLESLREVRGRRNEMIIGRLRELGLEITMDDVLESLRTLKRDGDTVGRPHIADALVRKGYVASMAEAFDRYLAKGAAAYANPPRISPQEAVRWILEAGGAPVLAHPGLYSQDGLIAELAAEGLVGLEVYHSDHTPHQEAHYAELARTHRLLATAGSDYHGERGGVVFHAPIGARRIPAEVVDALFNSRGETTA